MKLDNFTRAYLTCALWSSTADDGEPLDCHDYTNDNASLLSGLDDEQCGHDFWLTRNHHGAGFWDRGLGKIGQQLTEAAHTYGSVDLYIGDDGLIYS